MSKTTGAAVATALAAIGFALGYCARSSSDSGTQAPPAEAASEDAASDRYRDAILQALKVPDAFARAALLSTWLPSLPAEAAPAAQIVLEDPDLDLGGVEFVLLAQFWAIHDPAAAARWVLRWSATAFLDAAALPVVEQWARIDPEAAKEAVLVPWNRSAASQIGLVVGWFDSGRPGLEDYIRSLDIGERQQRALSWYARKKIQRDGPAAVIDWVESIPDDGGGHKLAAFRQVGSELAILEPDAAAAWCDRACDGPFGSGVRTLIARRWGRLDGPALMEWLSRAPEGNERTWAVRAGAQAWWSSDREGMTRKLEEMRADEFGAWFQPALQVYAGHIGLRDPEKGFEWCALIEDEEARQVLMIGIARQWRDRDAIAADAWLEQSPLSEEARARVRMPRQSMPTKQGNAAEAEPDDEAASPETTGEVEPAESPTP